MTQVRILVGVHAYVLSGLHTTHSPATFLSTGGEVALYSTAFENRKKEEL